MQAARLHEYGKPLAMAEVPHLNQDRFLAVNIPMFRVWVWESSPPNGAPSFLERTIDPSGRDSSCSSP